jgi:phage terminase large subunit-like protein
LEEYNKKRQAMGERQFQAIYQQKPLDLTSDFFHVDNLIFEERFEDYAIARCRSWDIASSDDSLGDARDFTAGVRMLRTPDQYWIFDFEHGQYGNDVKNVITNTAKRDSPAYTILLEPGTSGGAAGLLYEEYKTALTGYNTYQSLPKGTKADRATPLANAIYDGKVHVCINNNEQRELLLSQLKSFPNGKHDDLVDAIAYGYLWLKGHGNNTVATANKRKRKRRFK